MTSVTFEASLVSACVGFLHPFLRTIGISYFDNHRSYPLDRLYSLTLRRGQEGSLQSSWGLTTVELGVLNQLHASLAIICDVTMVIHVHLLEASHLFLDIHQDSLAITSQIIIVIIYPYP